MSYRAASAIRPATRRAALAGALTTPIGLAVLALPAAAADLPAIKTTATNQVPACVTPGRLMTFVKARNPKLDAQFDQIATEYMRHGEALGVRWDIGFFQMLVETGNLTFKGDVKPRQNNFAGLGATGGGEPGESFKDVSTGARAHLEHVLMYAGEKLDNPTAERTRKVQEWGVLTTWQKSIKGPMTFTHLTRKWSPKDRGYSNDIESVAASFASGECRNPDPRPELVAEARSGRGGAEAGAISVAKAAAPDKVSGAELARRAVEEARNAGDGKRAGLGAAGLAATAKPAPQVTILNAPKPETEAPATSIEPLAATPSATPPATKTETHKGDGHKDSAKAVAKDAGKDKAKVDTAAAAAPAAAAPAAATKCKVWQASYGGEKAVIIKAAAGAETNYTVLDVNEGSEKREAEAYIAAYAKGGQTVGEYPTSNQALDKAFELCPEG